MKRKTLEERLNQTRDWSAFTAEFDGESDRATALLAVAFLDVYLEQALTSFLVNDPQEVQRLLAPEQPLASFAARARMAYCLGLIDRPSFKDITLIREIRNEFAHSLQGRSFRDRDIAEKCAALKAPWIVLAPSAQVDSRRLFVVAVCFLGHALSGNAAVALLHRCRWLGDLEPELYGKPKPSE